MRLATRQHENDFVQFYVALLLHTFSKWSIQIHLQD